MRLYADLSEKLIVEVRDLYEKNVEFAEMIKILGVTRSQLYRLLHKAFPDHSIRDPKYTKPEEKQTTSVRTVLKAIRGKEDRIIHLTKQGRSEIDIARELKVPLIVLLHWLRIQARATGNASLMIEPDPIEVVQNLNDIVGEWIEKSTTPSKADLGMIQDGLKVLLTHLIRGYKEST